MNPQETQINNPQEGMNSLGQGVNSPQMGNGMSPDQSMAALAFATHLQDQIIPRQKNPQQNDTNQSEQPTQNQSEQTNNQEEQITALKDEMDSFKKEVKDEIKSSIEEIKKVLMT